MCKVEVLTILGRVCVPIDPKRIKEFKPSEVPQVQQLIAEIDAWDKLHPSLEEKKGMKDVKKTKLGDYIKLFKKDFLRPLLNKIRDEMAANQIQQSEPTSLDF